MNSEARLTEDAGHSAPRARQSGKAAKAAAAARQSVRADEYDEDQRDAMDNRGDDGDDDRFNAFLDSIDESALPDLPRFDGYHNCWVSTLNPHDRPERRARMGYEYILVKDVPGWKDAEGPKTGEYAGVVRVNEMVAMKLPLSLYNRYMRHWHHDEPLAEEEKIRAAHDEVRERAEAAGAGVVEEGDGTAGIVQRGQGPARFIS